MDISDVAISCDGQRYVMESDDLGLRVLLRTASDDSVSKPLTTGEPIEISRSISLSCNRCDSETAFNFIVGRVHRCSSCGQAFSWLQLEEAFAQPVDYPFRRVRDLDPSRHPALVALSIAKIDRAHIFGDDFYADLQECINRLGNVIDLEMGDLEGEYYFLSRFLVARYGSNEPTRFVLKVFFFYQAYRALDSLGGGWPRAELLRLGRELTKHISRGIPLENEEGDDWGEANAIAAPILLMAFARMKEIYGESDDADGAPKEELEFWSRMLFPVALGQIAATDTMHAPIRLFASVALIWSSYAGWIPDSEAGWVTNLCYNIIVQGAFKTRHEDESETRHIKAFVVPPSSELDLEDVLVAIANGLIGHIQRRQIQTTFYANFVFLRSFLYTPAFKEYALEGKEASARNEAEDELTQSFFQRIAWLYEQLSKEPDRWQLNKRCYWALEAGRLALAASRRFGGTELRSLCHIFLEGACIFVLRDEFLLLPHDRQLLSIERACETLTTLCIYYADIGWIDEALSLMGFYRGWIINARAHERSQGTGADDGSKGRITSEVEAVAQLFSWERGEMLAKLTGVDPVHAALAAGAGNPGGILQAMQGMLPSRGSKNPKQRSELVVFGDDFDDDRVYRAINDRLNASRKRILIASIAWTESPFDPTQIVAIAILCWGGGGAEQRMERVLWEFPKSVLMGIEVLTKIPPGIWREGRLQRLAAEASDRVINPFLAKLPDFDFAELAVCGPGTFAVLPLESIFANAGFPLLPVTTLSSLRPMSVANRAECATSRRRIAVMAFRGESLPQVEREIARITQLPGTQVSRIDCFDMTADAILAAFGSSNDIVHCCAHGCYIEDDPDASSLVFGDKLAPGKGAVSAAQIAYKAALRPGTLVVLSACSSALVPDDKANSWRGLAGAFLRAGASGVIAARWPVSDSAAAALFAAFYDRLTEIGEPQTALRDAKAALRGMGKKLEEWDCFGYFGAL